MCGRDIVDRCNWRLICSVVNEITIQALVALISTHFDQQQVKHRFLLISLVHSHASLFPKHPAIYEVEGRFQITGVKNYCDCLWNISIPEARRCTWKTFSCPWRWSPWRFWKCPFNKKAPFCYQSSSSTFNTGGSFTKCICKLRMYI